MIVVERYSEEKKWSGINFVKPVRIPYLCFNAIIWIIIRIGFRIIR